MNIQEAYNKGLNDAEDLAIVKLNNALNGVDDGPFNNPSMEDIRLKVLNSKPESSRDFKYIIYTILNRDVDVELLPDVDKSIFEILQFCKEIVGRNCTSKVSVKIKDFLTKLSIDLINKQNKSY